MFCIHHLSNATKFQHMKIAMEKGFPQLIPCRQKSKILTSFCHFRIVPTMGCSDAPHLFETEKMMQLTPSKPK